MDKLDDDEHIINNENNNNNNNFKSNIIANIIKVLHLLFIGFLIITPFTKYTGLLFLHCIFVPFIFFHWLLNNNTCVLTLLEKKFRGLTDKDEKEKSFTYKLINPIFNFTNSSKSLNIDEYINVFSYCLLVLLGCISLSKILYGYKTKTLIHIFDLLFIDKHI